MLSPFAALPLFVTLPPTPALYRLYLRIFKYNSAPIADAMRARSARATVEDRKRERETSITAMIRTVTLPRWSVS